MYGEISLYIFGIILFIWVVFIAAAYTKEVILFARLKRLDTSAYRGIHSGEDTEKLCRITSAAAKTVKEHNKIHYTRIWALRGLFVFTGLGSIVILVLSTSLAR